MRARLLLLLAMLVVALGGGYAYWHLRQQPPAGQTGIYQGYVDAHLLQVGSERGGRMVELEVEEGDAVQAGQIIARLDDALPKARLHEAEAKLEQARARLRQALAPRRRPQELEALRATVREAEAVLAVSKAEYDRVRRLVRHQTVPQAKLDAARGAYERDLARLQAARERLKAAQLPAREEEIALARAAVKAAEAAVESARRDLERTIIRAPAGGHVQEVLFRPGEVAAAGRPVILLLSPRRLRIRFYVPQAVRPRLKPGQMVRLSCDGCAKGLSARIVHLGQQVEYTPPVLFSRGFRQKLVFRIEARPVGEAARLPLGQPVDVHLPASAALASANASAAEKGP